MPYILIRGNLASYGHKNPWRVLVSGLKGRFRLLIYLSKNEKCYQHSDQSCIISDIPDIPILFSFLNKLKYLCNTYTFNLLNEHFCSEIAGDIEQLKRFACGGYCDDSTIVYLQHPCVILSALEVLGYKVVASSSTAVKQDYNEYMWTMRKEFSEPEPSIIVEQDNITNFSKEAMHYHHSNKDDEV